jgi:tRNA(adenine34) deaminase
MLEPYNDEHFMRQALLEAKSAMERDEVPVGAVVVCKNQIIARTHNLTEMLTDFTAHAEMQAFTAASEYLGNKYLNECTLYVTLEPCVLCAGAAFWTRLGRLVYGASDERRGYNRLSEKVLHQVTQVKGGVLEKECGEIMKTYFQGKRSKD